MSAALASYPTLGTLATGATLSSALSAYVTAASEQSITGLKTFDSIRLRNARVRPVITGAEAALIFHDNVDETILQQIGDLWRAGVSVGANNRRCFTIAADLLSGAFVPSLRFTPTGVLSLSTGCVLDAPTIKQGIVALNDLFQAKGDMVSYYNKTSVDNLLLDYVKTTTDQTAAGNKTFSGMTRLEGGVYTRRHIVSNTTTLGSFVVGSLLRFISGPPGYSVTLPSPSAHPGGRIAIHLQQSGVNILTPDGAFAGMGAGTTQTLTIAARRLSRVDLRR